MNIVWNLTYSCPWNCRFCCVDAIQVRNQDELSKVLEKELNINKIYEILDQIGNKGYSLDISGGDPLILPYIKDILNYAKRVIGKEKITISTTGFFINEAMADFLSKNVNEVQITLDTSSDCFSTYRPKGLSSLALNGLKLLHKYNVPASIQTVLTDENMNEVELVNLWNVVNEYKLVKWSLLRFFNVGRSSETNIQAPTLRDYVDCVSKINKITGNSAKVHFQYLLPGHVNYTLNCRCVNRSIGIIPDGKVVSCFWCLGSRGKILNENFYLGDLNEKTLDEILNTPKSKRWLKEDRKCAFFYNTDL